MTDAGRPARWRSVAAPMALAGLVAVVAAGQLALLGAFDAEGEVSRRDGRRWAEASRRPAPGQPGLLWSVQELELPGVGRVTSIAAAPTAPGAPAPLGVGTAPDPGDVLVSPALQRRLDDLPSGVVDRGRVAGVLGDEVLTRPDDLVLLTGWERRALARADPTARTVGRFVAEERELEDGDEIDLTPDFGPFLARLALVPMAAVPLVVATVLLLRRRRRPVPVALVGTAAGTAIGTGLVVAGAGLVAGGSGSPWFAADLRPSFAPVVVVGVLLVAIVLVAAVVADRAAPTGTAATLGAAVVLAVTVLATAALVDVAASDDAPEPVRGRAAYGADVVLSRSEVEGDPSGGRSSAALLDALRSTPGIEVAVPVHRADAAVAGLGGIDPFDATEVAVASCADAAAVLHADAAACPGGPVLARDAARVLAALSARERVVTLDFGPQAGPPVRLRAAGSWAALDRPSWEGLVPPEALPPGLLAGVGPGEVALRTDGRSDTVAEVAALTRRVAPGVDVRVGGELAPGPAEDPWSALVPLAALPAVLVLVGALGASAVGVGLSRRRRPPSTTPS